jgi:hypothetical protein
LIWIDADCVRAVATAGLWFQQTRSNKAEKEEKKTLTDKLKQMQTQLEIAGRQLVQSDRQHGETVKELRSAINDLKLEIRRFQGDWSDLKEEELFTREQVWEVIAEDDAKSGGRNEMPKLKGEWKELLDRLKEQQKTEKKKGTLQYI